MKPILLLILTFTLTACATVPREEPAPTVKLKTFTCNGLNKSLDDCRQEIADKCLPGYSVLEEREQPACVIGDTGEDQPIMTTCRRVSVECADISETRAARKAAGLLTLFQ